MRALILIAFSSLLSAQTFEVASIKPHAGPIPPEGGHVSISGLRLNFESWSILGFVMWSYNVKPYQISSPTPLDPTMYDLNAKAEDGRVPTTEEFRAMMQALLAERFTLKARRETREIPVYALVVSKSGAKLAETSPGDFAARTVASGRS